jgi:DNA polymerase elongation subunit (family B)
MYKRIFYDNYHNKIHFWYLDENGKNRHEEITPDLEYYILDKTGKSPITDIYGNPVIKQVAKDRQSIKILKECGEKTFEANIPQDIKFLQERYKGQDLKCDISQFQIATVDLEVSVSSEFPKAEEAKFPINLISIHLSKQNEIHTFGLYPYTGTSDQVKNYWYCENEELLLNRFIEFFRKAKVDICTSWNGRLFDFPYFIHRCENLKIEKSLSPLNIYKKKNDKAGYHISGGECYEIAGIAILDSLDLYKNFVYVREPSYSLNAIGLAVVGEGKTILDGSINSAWKTNWNQFVEYNIQDVLLVNKIEEKKKHIELAINLCYQSLVPFEKVYSSVNLIQGSVIKYAHEHNMVIPDRTETPHKDKMPGAFVKAQEGYYKYVINFDVESLYPTLIRQYNISPETLVIKEEGAEIDESLLIRTPLSEYKEWEVADGEKYQIGGIYYRRDIKGILPQIIEKIFSERKMYKKMYAIANLLKKGKSKEVISKEFDSKLIDDVLRIGVEPDYYKSQQTVRKILSNSLFGCVSMEFFFLYNNYNGTTITLAGQDTIKYLGESVNKYIESQWQNIAKKIFNCNDAKKVNEDVIIVSDTDSIYIHLHPLMKSINFIPKDNEDFRQFANKIINEVFSPFFKKILDIRAAKFKVENIINFQRENIITKMIVLAKKKYSMQIIENEDREIFCDNPKTKTKGIETVRTDTPDFSRKKIKTAIDYIFECENKDLVIERIRSIKEEFMKESVENIAIPRSVSEYSKYAKETNEYIEKGLSYPFKCPIHVRAAINYNYIVQKYNLPLQHIYDGTKLKFIHVKERTNELHQDVIGFIGKWPDEFAKRFEIDWERQWERGFQNIVERFFEVLKWGKIKLETNSLSDMFE